MELPAGYALTHWPAQAESGGEGRYVRWQPQSKRDGDALIVEFSARRAPGRHPATAYPAYYDEMSDARSLFDDTLEIQAPVGAR